MGGVVDDQVHARSKMNGLGGGISFRRAAAQRVPHFSQGLFFHLGDGDGCFRLGAVPRAGGAVTCICFWKGSVERLSS